MEDIERADDFEEQKDQYWLQFHFDHILPIDDCSSHHFRRRQTNGACTPSMVRPAWHLQYNTIPINIKYTGLRLFLSMSPLLTSASRDMVRAYFCNSGCQMYLSFLYVKNLKDEMGRNWPLGHGSEIPSFDAFTHLIGRTELLWCSSLNSTITHTSSLRVHDITSINSTLLDYQYNLKHQVYGFRKSQQPDRLLFYITRLSIQVGTSSPRIHDISLFSIELHYIRDSYPRIVFCST